MDQPSEEPGHDNIRVQETAAEVVRFIIYQKLRFVIGSLWNTCEEAQTCVMVPQNSRSWFKEKIQWLMPECCCGLKVPYYANLLKRHLLTIMCLQPVEPPRNEKKKSILAWLFRKFVLKHTALEVIICDVTKGNGTIPRLVALPSETALFPLALSKCMQDTAIFIGGCKQRAKIYLNSARLLYLRWEFKNKSECGYNMGPLMSF